jgi:hypothetical protein
MNTAGPISGPTNIAHPNTKAPGCLAFLCVCHACCSCLCASLCQAIFSHKRPHVLAGICRSWRNQQRKSKSKHKSLHHQIATGSLFSRAGLCTGICDIQCSPAKRKGPSRDGRAFADRVSRLPRPARRRSHPGAMRARSVFGLRIGVTADLARSGRRIRPPLIVND